jgi:hypothetical protein
LLVFCLRVQCIGWISCLAWICVDVVAHVSSKM